MSAPSRTLNRSLFGLIIGFFLVSAAFGQRLTQGTKPVTTKIPEYAEAFCSTVTGGFRVCRALKSEEGEADFVILKGATTVNRIEALAWKNIAVEPDGFFAYRGDLDKDGAAEIVLVSLEGVSNGMGVAYSTAYIFNGRTVESGSEPISFEIQEFGERENFIYDPRSRRTEILISYWAAYDSIEPEREMGTYLMGKWFYYQNGRLQPIFEKPTLARRFLNSFAAERDNGWFENRKPYTWLKDRRTHKFFNEPASTDKLIRTESGTIAKFAATVGKSETYEFQLKLQSGQLVKGRFGDRGPDESSPSLAIKAIGIWKERYIFPSSWSMSIDPETFLERIEGRRVRLETYDPGNGEEYTKMWLLD
jgi:hypothetical protein